MRRPEIVGINNLPAIAELGELLLADFRLLVIFFILASLSDMTLSLPVNRRRKLEFLKENHSRDGESPRPNGIY
jgi:hypothetical protein